jgi:hypothetical protein
MFFIDSNFSKTRGLDTMPPLTNAKDEYTPNQLQLIYSYQDGIMLLLLTIHFRRFSTISKWNSLVINFGIAGTSQGRAEIKYF